MNRAGEPEEEKEADHAEEMNIVRDRMEMETSFRCSLHEFSQSSAEFYGSLWLLFAWCVVLLSSVARVRCSAVLISHFA